MHRQNSKAGGYVLTFARTHFARAPRVRIIGLSSQKRFAQRLLFHRQNSKSESEAEAEIISMEINFQPKNTHGVFFGWGHNPTYP